VIPYDALVYNRENRSYYMPLLPFISDNDLYESTETLVSAAKTAESDVEKNPYKNVIDPFSALVDAARQGISIEEWMQQEKSRQIQKSFQNAVGDFHQNILSSMPKCRNGGKAGNLDVVCDEKKIIAEVKNKYNTMNSGAQVKVYDDLAGWLDFQYGKLGYTAYVVDVVPRNPKPYTKHYAPSDKGTKRQTRQNLLRIDGRSFYAMLSDYDNAIDMLYEVLPSVLSSILKIDESLLKHHSEFNDLFKRAYIKK